MKLELETVVLTTPGHPGVLKTQTSVMQLFCEINPIMDVRMGSKYASGICYKYPEIAHFEENYRHHFETGLNEKFKQRLS